MLLWNGELRGKQNGGVRATRAIGGTLAQGDGAIHPQGQPSRNGKPSNRIGAGECICRLYALALTAVAYAAGAWDIA